MAAKSTIEQDIKVLSKEMKTLVGIFSEIASQNTKVDKSFRNTTKGVRSLASGFHNMGGKTKETNAIFELFDGNMFSFAAKLPKFLKGLGLTALSFSALKYRITGLISEAYAMNQQMSSLGDSLTFLSSAGNGLNIQFAAYGGSKGSMGQVTSALRSLDTMGITTKSTLVELGSEFATLEQMTGVSADSFAKVGAGMLKYFKSTTKEAKLATNAFINMGLSAGDLSETLESAGELMSKLGTLTKMSSKQGVIFNQNYAAAVKTMKEFGVSTKTANEFLSKLADPENFQDTAKLLGQLGVPMDQYYKMLEGGEGSMDKFIESSLVGVADLGSKVQNMSAMARFNLSKTLGINPQMLTQMAGKSAAEVKGILAQSKKKAESEKMAEEKKAQTKANAERMEYQFTLLKMRALAPIMEFVNQHLPKYIAIIKSIADVTAQFYNLVIKQVESKMGTIDKVIGGMINFANKLTNAGSMTEMFSMIGETVGQGVGLFLSSILPGLITGVATFISGIAVGSGSLLKDVGDSLVKAIPKISEALQKIMPAVFDAFFTILAPALLNLFWSGIQLMFTSLKSAIISSFSTGWKMITSGNKIAGILTILSGVAVSIGIAVALWKTANNTWNTMKSIWDSGFNVARGSLNVLRAILTQLKTNSVTGGGGGGGIGVDVPSGSGSASGSGRKGKVGKLSRIAKIAKGGKLGTLLKGNMGKIGGSVLMGGIAIAGVASAGMENSQREKEIEAGTQSRLSEKKSLAGEAASAGGSLVGSLAGAKAGAIIGTMIGGPVGTIAGGIIGGTVGAMVGEAGIEMLKGNRKKSEQEMRNEEVLFKSRMNFKNQLEIKEEKELKRKVAAGKTLTKLEKIRLKELAAKQLENNLSASSKDLLNRRDAIASPLADGRMFGAIQGRGVDALNTSGGSRSQNNTGKGFERQMGAFAESIKTLDEKDKISAALFTADKMEAAAIAKKEKELKAKGMEGDALTQAMEKFKNSDEVQNAKLIGQMKLLGRAGLSNDKALGVIGDSIVHTSREQLFSQDRWGEVQNDVQQGILKRNSKGNWELKNIKEIAQAEMALNKLKAAADIKNSLLGRMFSSDKERKKANDAVLASAEKLEKLKEDTSAKLDEEEKRLRVKYYKGGIGFHERDKNKDTKPAMLSLRNGLKNKRIDLGKVSAV